MFLTLIAQWHKNVISRIQSVFSSHRVSGALNLFLLQPRPCAHWGFRQQANKAVKEKFRSEISISHSSSSSVLLCSSTQTHTTCFKVLIQGLHSTSSPCCCLIRTSPPVTSIFPEDLNIHKLHRPPCTISDPQCTQSAGPLTGTHLHIMSALRSSPSGHMPGTERHSLWDSTCLQHTAQSWVLHMVEMAKTPEVRYVGYTCFPASNASLPAAGESGRRTDAVQRAENFTKRRNEGPCNLWVILGIFSQFSQFAFWPSAVTHVYFLVSVSISVYKI